MVMLNSRHNKKLKYYIVIESNFEDQIRWPGQIKQLISNPFDSKEDAIKEMGNIKESLKSCPHFIDAYISV